LILSIAPDSFENCGAIQKILQGDAMMTTIGQTMPAGAAIPGLLDRERIIAAKGFNRWGCVQRFSHFRFGLSGARHWLKR
jgi:hypothetical protein